MDKIKSIYVSVLALIVALGALIMCIICCANKTDPKDLNEESVMAVLTNNPQMIMEALQKGEIKRQEERRAAARKLIADNAEEIYNSKVSPVIGNPKGSVTLVEFFDFSCGYCHRLAPTLLTIVEKNPDLRLVLKPLFFMSDQSKYAAKALYVLAKQGHAHAFYKKLMEHKGAYSEETVNQFAASFGVDVAQMKKDMESEEVRKAMADTASLAARVNISGVPTMVINGGLLQTLSEADIQRAIDAAK